MAKVNTKMSSHSSDIILAPKAEITATEAASVEAIIERFLAAQDVKESSRSLYRRTLRPFFRFLSTEGVSLNTVARADIIRYKEALLSSGASPLTVSSYLTAVRKFFSWAEAEKIYPNVSKAVKTPKRRQAYRKQALTAEQSRRLLDHYRQESLRDYAIINLMLCTGLRCIEVARATVSDLTLKAVGGAEPQRVLLVQGKGRVEKDAFVILNAAVYEPIKRYLESRGSVKAQEPLFASTSNANKGGTLTTRTISQIAKDGLKAIGLDDRAFTAHSLRHSTASILIKNGATAEEVKDVLRHASTAITQVYYASVADEVRLERNTEARLAALLH